MPIYFLFFLAMLAATLLLYVGAAGMTLLTRRPLPGLFGAERADLLHAVGVALLWCNVGTAWMLYFNVYQIHVDMSALGNAAFQAFAHGYVKRLPIVVLPYGAACLAWAIALWGAPARFSRRALWGIATLLIVSIASTPWAAGAQDDLHDHGFTMAAYDQLQSAHLVRTLAVTLAAVWAFVAGWRRPKQGAARSGGA